MSKMDEMKKYIIEFSEDPHTIRLMKIKNGDKFPTTEFKAVKPYTEPNLEQVKRDYDAWYEKGLADAWEAAKKVAYYWIWSGQTSEAEEIFGTDDVIAIFKSYSASEAIEKIRQYEQEKEEIQVGDEVKSGDEKYIVLQKYLNNIDELMVVLFNRRDGEIGTWHMYNANGAIFEKTGRHFQEIAEVLRKMKES